MTGFQARIWTLTVVLFFHATTHADIYKEMNAIAQLTVQSTPNEDFWQKTNHEILAEKVKLYGRKSVCQAIIAAGENAAVLFEDEILGHGDLFTQNCRNKVFALANSWNEKQLKLDPRKKHSGDFSYVSQREWGPSRNIYVDPYQVSQVSGPFERRNSNYIMSQLKPGEVVLTFDDGPYDNPFSKRGSLFYRQPTTKMVLAQLHQENVQAMFFVMGRSLKEGKNGRSWKEKMFPAPQITADGAYQVGLNPEDGSHSFVLDEAGWVHQPTPSTLIGQPLYGRPQPYAGHTLATHSQNHKNIAKLSPSEAEREILRGRDALKNQLGIDSSYFRFPFGAHNSSSLETVAREGLVAFDWEVDSRDTQLNDRDAIMNHILKQLRQTGKGVILFHDTRRVTATHLGWMIRQLKAAGYTPANVVMPSAI